MACEFIRSATVDGICTITLDRPARMNAITPAMHQALAEAFDAFAADEAARVCIVTGAGDRAFCAGSDLAAFQADGGAPYPASGYAGIAGRFDLDKPVIAAVNGACLGGGFELALACDMIVAADTATFGLPEPKVGLIAIGGGIHRLVRQVGIKQAMGPLLTGDTLCAEDGFRMGFVSAVVPAAELMAATLQTARRIAANAPLAVRLTKELAMWGLDQPTLADALAGQTDQPSFQRWRQSADAREGPRAFTEKRPPQWTGR